MISNIVIVDVVIKREEVIYILHIAYDCEYIDV